MNFMEYFVGSIIVISCLIAITWISFGLLTYAFDYLDSKNRFEKKVKEYALFLATILFVSLCIALYAYFGGK